MKYDPTMAAQPVMPDVGTLPSVWIVDDSPLACTTAVSALSPEFACEVFLDGGSVLERLSEGESPDVLVLDWAMPGVSGLDVCRIVRAAQDEVSLPILVVTAHSDSADVLEALASGANDHASKPFRAPELLARTRTLARTRRQHLVALRRELQLAETVRANEAELRLVTDSLPVLISFVDSAERYRFVNKAYEHWFGVSCEQLRGRSVREFIGEAAYAVMGPYVRRGLAGENVSFEQHGVPYRHGGTRDVFVRFVPHLNGDGGVDGYVALLEDITDARRQAAERELLARQRDEAAAQQASFEKQLIGIVSHDLRTPLGTILLGTSLLVAREDLDQGVTKTLTRIQNAAARATRMVDDLLDFTQARLAGKIAIERRDCNLQRLVDEVIAELEMSHAQRQLIVRHEGGGEGVWDPDRIKQVVQNLLVNALKYSPGDTPVCVTTQSQGEHIAIRVHNGGEPIAEEKLPVLFEPMQRAAGHVRDAARSVGLGLYIVRQLVEAHGGTVSVRSSADEGTEFMVRLPHRSGS